MTREGADASAASPRHYTPLGRLILRIAGQYARRVQQRLNTTGHMFEKRCHAVLVDADEYLLELLRFIHVELMARPQQHVRAGHLHRQSVR